MKVIVSASCNVLQMFIKSLKSGENTQKLTGRLCQWCPSVSLLGMEKLHDFTFLGISPLRVSAFFWSGHGKIRKITTSPPGWNIHSSNTKVWDPNCGGDKRYVPSLAESYVPSTSHATFKASSQYGGSKCPPGSGNSVGQSLVHISGCVDDFWVLQKHFFVFL